MFGFGENNAPFSPGWGSGFSGDAARRLSKTRERRTLDLVRLYAVQDPKLDCFMRQPTTKTERLEARITPDLHALLKRAAQLEGRSVTDFVLTAARAAAEQRFEQEQVIRLSLEDQRAFVEAILNPPEPTPALRHAFRRHRELIAESR